VLALAAIAIAAAIIIIVTMLIITFGIGNGKFWADAQHPFNFALLYLVFIFTGPGKWSVDGVLFNK
jgi:uncharacterized membrane protein YphA (DoxX/SURF4 family)